MQEEDNFKSMTDQNSSKSNYKYSKITEKIIGAAYKVYKVLGYGFLEKVYENALYHELFKSGVRVNQQTPINVYYDSINVGNFYADLVVEDKVIVELKAVSNIDPIHEVQLVNYLKRTGIEVGLLINFGKQLEVKRRVLTKEFIASGENQKDAEGR